MTSIVVEIVVDCMEQSVLIGTTNLRTTARSVVDVVSLECNLVVTANQQECPVVVVIAASRPACVAVDLSVGDGDALAEVVTCNNMLAADERSLDVVNLD